jgi:hypothetical protein
MKIEALVVNTTSTRNISGLLSEVDGLKSISFNTVNLAHTDKLVFVDMLLTDGTEHRVFCSKAVSAGLRSKEISKENLLSFPIVPFQSEDEAGVVGTRYYIQMPDGASHKVTFNVADLQLKAYEPKLVNWEELIA